MIDLDKPIATTSQTVEIVDGLVLDTLKNWDKNGLLVSKTTSRSERYAHVKRTARDLITLQIMVALARFDFKPSISAPLALQITEAADSFIGSEHFTSRFGQSEHEGQPQYLFTSDAAATYRRAHVIYLAKNDYEVKLLSTEQFMENFFRVNLPQTVGGHAYLTVEADITFALVINRIVRVLGNVWEEAR